MTYLIYIFALASHAMILYIYAPILSTDSQSYCEAMTTFLNGAIDKWRTPFYPLFIYLCKLISPIDNFLFTVCVMQSLIFIYSAKFLHLLSGRFIKNENIKLFILAIYSIHPSLTVFNIHILSESLALSFMVFLIYNLIRFSETLKTKFIFSSISITLVLLCLRPAMLSILPVMAVYFTSLYIIKKKKTFLYALMTILIPVFFQILEQ